MKLQVLVVEDEVLIAETIRLYLEQQGHQVVAICISFKEAVAVLKKTTPDIVLLDIRLYGPKSGIDVARYLENLAQSIPYVFITSQYDPKTLAAALETSPYGYLVKPLHKETLWTTVEVAYAKWRHLQNSSSVEFTISDGSKKYQMIDRDVLYIKSEHVYARIFLHTGSDIFARLSLSDFIKSVTSPLLFRCHRSYIINLSRVKAWESDAVQMGRGVTVPVSRSHRERLKDFLR